MDDISKIENEIWNLGKQRAEIIAPLAEKVVVNRKYTTNFNKWTIGNYHQQH
jgi:hypothetical protein